MLDLEKGVWRANRAHSVSMGFSYLTRLSICALFSQDVSQAIVTFGTRISASANAVRKEGKRYFPPYLSEGVFVA